MIGLCGAQRVGKSTLARAFAEVRAIPYLETTAGEVYAELGMDPKLSYPIEKRLEVQEKILEVFTRQYEAMTRTSAFFITDRTPFDLAAYMLADVERQTLVDQPELAVRINAYVDNCFKTASRFFAVCVLVQPGIKVVEADGKAPGCPAYMEHINTLQLGLLCDDRNMVRKFMIQRDVLTVERRLASLDKALHAAMEAHRVLVEKTEPVFQ